MNHLLDASTTSRKCNFRTLMYLSVLSAFILIGCSKDEVIENDGRHGSTKALSAGENTLNFYDGLDRQTLWELQQARAASARYRHIENALKDGYVDIGVVLQNMGYHYLKPALNNATFDPRKPEILVYNLDDNGDFQLVAVEYAIPIALMPEEAPKGFTGDDDNWTRNDENGLWLLHAWVWQYNPEGVFNPQNPLVDVDIP